MINEIRSIIDKWHGNLIIRDEIEKDIDSVLSNSGEAVKIKAYRLLIDSIDRMDAAHQWAWRDIRILFNSKLKKIDVTLSDAVIDRIRVFADGGKSINEPACLSLIEGFEKAIAKGVLTGNEKATVINRYLQKKGYLECIETIPTDKTIESWIDSYSTQFYSNNRSK